MMQAQRAKEKKTNKLDKVFCYLCRSTDIQSHGHTCSYGFACINAYVHWHVHAKKMCLGWRYSETWVPGVC